MMVVVVVVVVFMQDVSGQLYRDKGQKNDKNVK